jgi:hypothetical protein
MTLLSYSEFLFETYGKVKADSAKENLLHTLSKTLLTERERTVFNFLLKEGFQEDIVTILESEDSSLNEESLLQKAKERFDNAKETIKSKGKEALDKMSDSTKNLLKIGGNILKPIKAILEKIGAGIKKAWESGKQIAQQAVDKFKDKIVNKVKNLIKDGDKKKSLIEEMGNLKAMAGAGTKFVTGGFIEAMGKGVKKAATSDEKNEGIFFSGYLEAALVTEVTNMINSGYSIDEIIESLENDLLIMNEGGHGHDEGGLNIPFVSKLMNKIGHMPPFSYFHDLGSKAEEAANNALNRASIVLSKVGNAGGPFKFALIGGLVGVAVGYYSETFAKTGVFAAINAIAGFAVPGLGILKSIIGGVGLALAIYGVVKTVVGQGEKEGGEEENHDEEEKDKEKE